MDYYMTQVTLLRQLRCRTNIAVRGHGQPDTGSVRRY